MDTHIFETFVSAPDVEKSAELLCATLRDWSFSTSTNFSERHIDFNTGRVVIIPAVAGLHLRVEAQDLLSLLGMRSVLQAALSQVSAHLFSEVDWHLANCELLSETCPKRGTPGWRKPKA